MYYVTGDTHGDFSRYENFMKTASPSADDTMIVLGDAALNYFGDERDAQVKTFVNGFPFTTFCVHGNHEMRPHNIPTYELIEFHDGLAWREPDYPSIFFAKDGEVYDFGGLRCIAIGGAYSVDKQYRLDWGYRWFEDEQPSVETKAYVENQLDKMGWKIDIVLSHTCPQKYMPTEAMMSGLDQDTVDQGTEQWLDAIEDRLDYREWYCGHFHTEKKVDKIHFLYKNISML